MLCVRQATAALRGAVRNRILGLLDLLERPADVHGAGAPARLCGPRHGPVEGIVEFEHSGPVTEALQGAPIARRQLVARDRGDLARGQVEQHGSDAAQIAERPDLAAGLDLAPQRAQERGHRLGDRL
jgi:hypothetical protein